MDGAVVGPSWRQTPALHLLTFLDLWKNFTSKPFTYDDVLSVKDRGVAWLEFRKRLNYTRDAALNPTVTAGEPNAVITRAEDYIGCMTYLLEHLERFVDEKGLNRMTFRWVSAMVPGNLMGPWVINLVKSPALDQAMMIQLVGVALWQKAQERGASIYHADVKEPHMATLTACVELLRKAAGAFRYLSNTLWPSLANKYNIGKDQAPEVQPWFAGACANVCLGLAQYLVAYRSYCKASSFAVTAQLYVAASDFFEAASDTFRNTAQEGYRPVTDRFKRYVALCSTLSQAWARLSQVRQLMAAGDAGHACVQATHAKNELRLCAYVAEGDHAWTAVFGAAEADVVAAWEQCEQDRMNVYMQPLSKEAPIDLPTGKPLVAPMEYSLPRHDLDIREDDM